MREIVILGKGPYGGGEGTVWGAPEVANMKLLYAKGIKLIPPSNNELIHLYTKKLNISLKKCKQALVTKRVITQFMKHTATLSK